MSRQTAKLIETTAYDRGIDLYKAPIEQQLYIYALTFEEIHQRLSGSLINFPQDSLQEIVEAFEYIFHTFNALLSKPMERILYNDISNARVSLTSAIAFANTALAMQQALIQNTPEYFQMHPTYQQHLLNCTIHIAQLNDQIAGWLQFG